MNPSGSLILLSTIAGRLQSSMSKIIVLMGAPGAGKGTQARLLQERLNLPQISTGDIFRGLENAHSSLAQEVREIMAKGQLVPDDLTIGWVSADACAGGKFGKAGG